MGLFHDRHLCWGRHLVVTAIVLLVRHHFTLHLHLHLELSLRVNRLGWLQQGHSIHWCHGLSVGQGRDAKRARVDLDRELNVGAFAFATMMSHVDLDLVLDLEHLASE